MTLINIGFSVDDIGRESPELARHPRRFAIKSYIEYYNCIVVRLVSSIYFCYDPAQGADIIKPQSRHSDDCLLNYNATSDLLMESNPQSHLLSDLLRQSIPRRITLD